MRKKTTLWTGAVSLVLVVVYMLVYTGEGLLLRFVNALALIGVLILMLALSCHVRNGGQFRVFGYPGYRRYRKEKQKALDEGLQQSDTEILDFHEYSQQKYEKKWDPIPFYICGGILVVLSLAFIPFL